MRKLFFIIKKYLFANHHENSKLRSQMEDIKKIMIEFQGNFFLF